MSWVLWSPSDRTMVAVNASTEIFPVKFVLQAKQFWTRADAVAFRDKHLSHSDVVTRSAKRMMRISHLIK